MAAARTAAPARPGLGLSPADLESIRDTLKAGRKPKVMFTEAAGQVAGQVGQVIELTDPSLSEEWVVVRFGRDELPFSPTDLTIPPRNTARRVEAKVDDKAEARREPARPELKLTLPPVPPPREEKSVTTSTVDTLPAPAVADTKPVRRPGRAAKPKAPAALTVTLAYAEGEWTVAAQQGSKALAKPYAIRPAEALKMVGLLDVPGVHEAVDHIVTAERTATEQAAQRLRAELAEIEARLAELRDVG